MASLSEVRRLQQRIVQLESFYHEHGIYSQDKGANILADIEKAKIQLQQASEEYTRQLELEKQQYETEEFNLIQKLGKAIETRQLIAGAQGGDPLQKEINTQRATLTVKNIENELAFFRQQTNELIVNELIGNSTTGFSVRQRIIKRRINGVVTDVNELVGITPLKVAGVIDFDVFNVTTIDQLLKVRSLLNNFSGSFPQGFNKDGVRQIFESMGRGDITREQALSLYQKIVKNLSITHTEIENLIQPQEVTKTSMITPTTNPLQEQPTPIKSTKGNANPNQIPTTTTNKTSTIPNVENENPEQHFEITENTVNYAPLIILGVFGAGLGGLFAYLKKSKKI